MRPNNEFTSSVQRFFFPLGHEVEHHESVDTTELPAVVYAPGKYHFIVVETADGTEEACDPYWNESHILGGSTIKQIAAVKEGSGGKHADILRDEELDILDREEQCYTPSEGEIAIVRLSRRTVYRNLDNEKVPGDGIFFLPVNQSLPTSDELELKKGEALYEFIGYIDGQDRLVVPNYLSHGMRKIVDWCIANALAQNRLEHALLRHDLPREATLTGLISVEPKVRAYIEYFDRKHGSKFLPQTDPKRDTDRFPALSDTESESYHFLVKSAHRFMSEPRTQNRD